jgi:hypothetical protein
VIDERRRQLTFPAAHRASNVVQSAAQQACLRAGIPLGIEQLLDSQ